MVKTVERTVTIKSERDATRFILKYSSGDQFTAALESSHFSGQIVSSIYHTGPPSILFDDMAAHWTGWAQPKRWGTLEDDLRLTATSDALGHIELEVVMRASSDPAGWRLQVTLELVAGQLEEVARLVRNVFTPTI